MKRKIILFCSTALISLNSISQAEADSVFHYDQNGNEVWYYIQKDVYSFRLQNGQEYVEPNIDMNVVDTKYHQSGGQRQLNVVEFKNTSPESGRLIERERARNKPNFECEFPVVTKEKNVSKDLSKWATSDDVLIVAFSDPHISQNEVQAFANRNDLILIHKPSNDLNNNYIWSYLFSIQKIKCGVTNPITTAKEIYSNEDAIVEYVFPNITSIEFSTCTTVNDMNIGNQPDALWQIRNNGGNIYNSQSGTTDADADICECWGEGYNGEGVKIGVLDGHGFDFNHEDLSGQILSGFNFTNGNVVPMNNSVITVPGQAHATLVSSIIVSKVNNNAGLAGVAYGSKVVPYLFSAAPGEITLAIQRAITDNLDVLNMSFSAGIGDIFLADYQSATQDGRKDQWDPTISRGLILVSSAGNYGVSNVGYFPAASQYVIGVGASNPDDKLANNTDGWVAEQWTTSQPGSDFGPFYDVVAPGSVLKLADFMGTDGYSPENYVYGAGTSGASAIVSGIVAILLQKNPQLGWQEVHDLIRSGADKVNPTIYNYNYDNADLGRSFEMQYGRVNCMNSLSQTALSTKNLDKKEYNFSIYDFDKNTTTILYKYAENQRFKLTIFDSFGKEVNKFDLDTNSKEFSFDNSKISNGIYFFTFYAGSTPIKTLKYVKI